MRYRATSARLLTPCRAAAAWLFVFISATMATALGLPDTTWSTATDVAIDKRGRIVVGGLSGRTSPGRGATSPTERDAALWRLTEDGLLDRSFSGDGILFLPGDIATARSTSTIGTALAIDPEDRIIAGGGALNSENGLAAMIWRLDSEGGLEVTGTADLEAVAAIPGLRRVSVGRGVAIDSGGRAVVSATAALEDGARLYLWRIERAGTVDRSFGARGPARESEGGAIELWSPESAGADSDVPDRPELLVSTFAVDHTGRVLIVGNRRPANAEPPLETAIWCLAEDGTVDRSYGQGGVARTGYALAVAVLMGDGVTVSNPLAIVDDQGRLLLVARMSSGTGDRRAIALRFLADGVPDNEFGQNGVALLDGEFLPGDWSFPTDVAFDNARRLVISGQYNGAATVWRLTDGGVPDLSFGDDGRVVHEETQQGEQYAARALAIDESNRIVIVGTSVVRVHNPDVDGGQQERAMIAWRLTETGELDESFGQMGSTVSYGPP